MIDRLLRRLRSLRVLALALWALALLDACGAIDSARGRSGGPPPSVEQPVKAEVPAVLAPLPLRAVSVLTLELTGLRPLFSGHYEGCAVFGNEQLSTGKFRVAPDGTLVALNGTAIAAFPLARDIVEARQISITVEPEGDRDATPSGIVILNGALVGGRARLAFPVPLDALAGGFTLASPTDDDTSNESAGVWFSDASGTQPALVLPELPAGWIFEGWVGTQGLSFSTGRFARPGGPDFAAPFSGTRPSPRFPGEDFVTRLPVTVRLPVNLADGASTVAIAIEPDLGGQDPSGPGPFWLLPLRREIPAGAPTGVAHALEFDRAVVPSGVATVG